jgi:hypothetical protein
MKSAILLVSVGLAIGIGVTVTLATRGTSTPSRDDVMATRLYLRARLALQQALAAGRPATSTALDAFVADVKSRCEGVLRGSPSRHASTERLATKLRQPDGRDVLVGETYRGLELTLLRSQTAPRRAFVNAVDDLTWSDRKVTRLIHSIVTNEAAWLDEPVPDACHDMIVWVSSGYSNLPATLIRSLPIGERAIPEQTIHALAAMGYSARFPERDAIRLLSRYTRPGEPDISHRTEQVEIATAAHQLKLLTSAIYRAELVLGLPHCSRLPAPNSRLKQTAAAGSTRCRSNR